MNPVEFRHALMEKGIALTEVQMKQFDIYFNVLADWNRRMNLTAITDESGVYLKHFYDSVTAAFYEDFKEPVKLVDIGAGAGFPSLPLKICFPELNVTIVDSLNKRITFLNALAQELDLKKVAFFHDRVEQFARKKEHREAYDIAISRAVARLPVLCELCLPLVKKKGRFIAMKGAGVLDELSDAQKALHVIGGELKENHNFLLPEENSERAILVFSKNKHTPGAYPRKPGTPNKEPII